jgi:hypothetical protein
MFVAGTSTRHPWEKWPKRCWESLEVGSTISRLNQTLTQQFEAWRQRPRPRALAHPVPGWRAF